MHKLVGRVPGLPMPAGIGRNDSIWMDAGGATEWRNVQTPKTNLDWKNSATILQGAGNRTFIPMVIENGLYNLAANSASGNSSMIEKIRAVLDKQIPIAHAINELTLESVLTRLRDAAGKEVPFRILLGNSSPNPQKFTVSLMPGELPLAAWLIAVQDENPNLVFLVREYGILVTTRDRALKDAISVADFWRSSKAAKAKEEKLKNEKK